MIHCRTKDGVIASFKPNTQSHEISSFILFFKSLDVGFKQKKKFRCRVMKEDREKKIQNIIVVWEEHRPINKNKKLMPSSEV